MNFVPSNSNLVNNDETGYRQTNRFKTKAKRIVFNELVSKSVLIHRIFKNQLLGVLLFFSPEKKHLEEL